MVEDAYLQLYDNAFSIFSKQDNRLFFIGFTMCGASLRAYLIHRGGILESAPISLHTEPWAVAQSLMAVTYSKLVNIGYDPTISTPTYYMPAPTNNPWNRIIIIQVAGEMNRVSLEIDTCLFSSHSIQGRGTHVFACLHPSGYGGQFPIM